MKKVDYSRSAASEALTDGLLDSAGVSHRDSPQAKATGTGPTMSRVGRYGSMQTTTWPSHRHCSRIEQKLILMMRSLNEPTQYAQKTSQLGWRILGISEDGARVFNSLQGLLACVAPFELVQLEQLNFMN